MQKQFTIPNSGNMPAIEQLPIQLQKPIYELSQIKSVDCATAAYSDETLSEIKISINFHYNICHESSQVLSCFSDCEFRASFFLVDPKEKTIRLTLVRKKFWLN